MNVGELKKLLESFEDDKVLFMARDEEGNSYHRLEEATLEPGIMLGGLAYPLILWPGARMDEGYVEDYEPDEDDRDVGELEGNDDGEED